ncbi:golgi phosphoprotein 3 [Nematocida displodere]|uniref:Golgi phosphoprotein 3 n=1 Tax=Nematocida displodere TaxID=1805483 RepID=A0A177EKU8_9MICR|nr:golgi phosphoprotein 3 [Nematocida displodere]
MFEEFAPRKRDVNAPKAPSLLQGLFVTLTLPEILVLFSASGYQSMIPLMRDPVSISVRALGLVELVLRGALFIDENKIVRCTGAYVPTDDLHEEICATIKKSKRAWTADKWLLALNGETINPVYIKYHIKHARKRLGKMLIKKKLFKKPLSKKEELLRLFAPSKSLDGPLTDEVAKKGSRAEIIAEVSRFLLENTAYQEPASLKMSAIVCAFSYCCIIEDVLLTMPLKPSEAAKKKVAEITARFQRELGSPESTTDWSVLCVLRGYLKLASWV